jgi:Xaa-Pro dipeptidase
LDEDKPQLFFYIPNDFWHETSSLNGDFWEDSFDIKVMNSFDKIWDEAQQKVKKSHVISPHPQKALSHGSQNASEELIHALNWIRGQKTEYEIECIKKANEKASWGHKKAHKLFIDGASEWDIFQNYLLASRQRESDLPYNSIVAFNRNSAVLHYQFPKHKGSGETFLIDAGARYLGYCSDITRTHLKDSVEPVYKEIHHFLNEAQKKLCEMVKPSVQYVDIHRQAYHDIAHLLIQFNLFKGSFAQAIELNLPFTFYPHGVGHPIGIQVHDVGGKQIDSQGSIATQPEDFPFLRTLRTIQENDVLTIEPGFYFISPLLEDLRGKKETKNLLNWELIEKLTPYGGIRIEDNVVARPIGPENLTRPFVP